MFSRKLGQKVCEGEEFKSEVRFNQLLINY